MIRPAEKKDIPGILAIYNDAILHTTAIYDYTPHTLEQRTAWFEAHQKGGWPVFVWEENGCIAGFADLQLSGYINPFFVESEHAGRGVGRALMAQIHSAAQQAGMHSPAVGRCGPM